MESALIGATETEIRRLFFIAYSDTLKNVNPIAFGPFMRSVTNPCVVHNSS